MDLWNKNTEKQFFEKALELSSPEKLFYQKEESGHYVAYWPKSYKGRTYTLQSRNSLIGDYTEKWARDLVEQSIKDTDLYAVQGAVCEELDLTSRSDADVVISKNDSVDQTPEDICMIFEVKMSVIWNWEYHKESNQLECIGDYKSHKGNPGLLRSDSMLKAIGKSLNIRVSSHKSSTIPIIILGNTPINESYHSKVDNSKQAGIIQGFWSVNPAPLDNNGDNIKNTPDNGFYRFDNFKNFKSDIKSLLNQDLNFFASMKDKKELGRIIEKANQEKTYERKAEKFLNLIRE